MSRQSSPDQPTNNNSSPASSPQADSSDPPSSSFGRRMSKDSEGYPSWLPRRPPPPAPASTHHSSAGLPETGLSEPPFVGGRKPTPRSVRIVSLQEPSYGEKGNREATDDTRVANIPRVWSRAARAALSPAMFAAGNSATFQLPRPKFHSTSLHLELLLNPSFISRLYFYLFPILVFLHVPLQSFFDFNAAFILFQVSKYPNLQASGIPGSGRNWALGTAAYLACWLAWVFVVFLLYELLFSFVRRWRVKRPLILPIYLSSSAFNLVAMTSYTNFCFLQHIRFSAFFGENGSIRDGLSETFWYYSQNFPTVVLLMPRAGLSLALLLTFSSPNSDNITFANAGVGQRDTTFFRVQDGTLTNYARGVLIANAAWTGWRILILLISWIGLWVVSGQGCAGLCGPRDRWEEENGEKRRSAYSDAGSDDDIIPWEWREATRMRIQDAYDFCLTARPSLRWSGKNEVSEGTQFADPDPTRAGESPDGLQQVLAAVGFPSLPPPARRGVLSEDLFESPKDNSELTGLADIIPKIMKRPSKDERIAGPSGPLLSLPYPFTAPGAQMSSADKVPFPPSPAHSSGKKRTTPSGSGSSSESGTSSGSMEDDEEEDDDSDEDDKEGDEDQEIVEEPSMERASGSMSSLGQPVSPRYPFQYRRPGRGNSMSSGAASHMTHSTNPQSVQSQGTQSTGNRESSDSHSPRSHVISISDKQSSGIPMPPRHPQYGQGRSRQRAGTVPDVVPMTPSPVAFPKGARPRAQTRADTESFDFPGFGSDEAHDLLDESESSHSETSHSDASHEDAERDDVVGLLSSAAPSPRTSLLHRGSSASQHRLHGSRSGSNSRTNSNSSSSRSGAISISVSIRSRAQSLMQNIGATSHSSVELVRAAIRSRANSSVARLEEESTYYSDGRTHSRSGSGSVRSSGNENNTFGVPVRRPWALPPSRGQLRVEEEPAEQRSVPPSPLPELTLDDSPSNVSVTAPSTVVRGSPASSEPEFIQVLTASSSPVDIPRGANRDRLEVVGAGPRSLSNSPPDISTAAQSFVTAPATITGATESSGRTVSSWGDPTHLVDRADGTWRPAPA